MDKVKGWHGSAGQKEIRRIGDKYAKFCIYAVKAIRRNSVSFRRDSVLCHGRSDALIPWHWGLRRRFTGLLARGYGGGGRDLELAFRAVAYGSV